MSVNHTCPTQPLSAKTKEYQAVPSTASQCSPSDKSGPRNLGQDTYAKRHSMGIVKSPHQQNMGISKPPHLADEEQVSDDRSCVNCEHNERHFIEIRYPYIWQELLSTFKFCLTGETQDGDKDTKWKTILPSANAASVHRTAVPMTPLLRHRPWLQHDSTLFTTGFQTGGILASSSSSHSL